MSIIDEKIPRILYKYRSLKCIYTENMLSRGEIYFSNYEQLNDPFERFFSFQDGAYYNDPKNNLKFYDAEARTQRMMDYIRKDKTLGVFSLSDNNISLPLYAHYADGFRGVCIGFDWTILDLKLDSRESKPYKMTYSKQPPVITGYTARPSDWEAVFGAKSEHFSWENEWRIRYTSGVFCKKDAIKEIIFGHHCTEENRNKVISWVNDLKNVRFYETKPQHGKYEVGISVFSMDNARTETSCYS